MTPTEIEKINREFAIKVMLWVEIDGCWFTQSRSRRLFIKDFDPYHRIDHAWLGLEKFIHQGCRYILWNLDDGHHCHIFHTQKTSLNAFGLADTAPAAITLACLEAKKEER